LAHGVLFATGELVYVQGAGNKPEAAGYWNNIPGPEVRLLSQKLPARLAGTLCYYLASNLFAAAKRAPWAEHHQSCYSFIIKRTYLPDNP